MLIFLMILGIVVGFVIGTLLFEVTHVSGRFIIDETDESMPVKLDLDFDPTVQNLKTKKFLLFQVCKIRKENLD